MIEYCSKMAGTSGVEQLYKNFGILADAAEEDMQKVFGLVQEGGRVRWPVGVVTLDNVF